MGELERKLYWGMVRTIRILGGKSDILKNFDIIDSSMPQRESIAEIYRVVKNWNYTTEEKVKLMS